MIDIPKVLIVILNYKTYWMTLELIEQLKELDYSNYEILIIDNGSPNESAEVLKKKKYTEKYSFIGNEFNSGYATGNNIGVRYAVQNGFQYSWILNNDVKIKDCQILKKMVALAEDNRDIVCVGPKVIDLDGNAILPFIERPTFFDLTLGMGLAKRRRLQYADVSNYVYRVFGCCMLLRNEIMEMVNFFDERTFLYCEEEILAEKFLGIGKKTYYLAETEIVHMDSVTVKIEQGTKSMARIKTVLDSMDIYLKYYRKYNILCRNICKFVRAMIMILRS